MPQGVFFRLEVSTSQSVFCHEKFVNIPLGFIAQNLFVVIIAKQILSHKGEFCPVDITDVFIFIF